MNGMSKLTQMGHCVLAIVVLSAVIMYNHCSVARAEWQSDN